MVWSVSEICKGVIDAHLSSETCFGLNLECGLVANCAKVIFVTLCTQSLSLAEDFSGASLIKVSMEGMERKMKPVN